MELFYNRLRENVKDEIAKEDRPDTFDEFVSKIIKVDNRLYARQLERGGKNLNHRANNLRYQPNVGRRQNGNTSYGTHLGPMELGNVNKEKGKTCYNCGKTRHFVNKCRTLKKPQKPVTSNRHLSVANRDELPIRNISMVNSEEYFLDTDRFAEYDELISDEDWEFGT